ncbi:AbrB/MazE/SpoVT family DNA-binding domain-containing protein [Candidatus Woesearchaeota archaeon]|nr:AbrB/MazE/SpoVT family DNA-binding domain-containing protein [Candidatus Woesearchaeota archaeon]
MTIATLRKWGNSLGIVLPKSVIEERQLKEGDEVFLTDVLKVTDLSDFFGKIKTGEPSQKFKDDARKGWKEKRFS